MCENIYIYIKLTKIQKITKILLFHEKKNQPSFCLFATVSVGNTSENLIFGK
jgi:hypothetical protein